MGTGISTSISIPKLEVMHNQIHTKSPLETTIENLSNSPLPVIGNE